MGGEGQNVGVSYSLWGAGLKKHGSAWYWGVRCKHDRCEIGQGRVAGKDTRQARTQNIEK
jgi:hypothetical protein